jgi:transporter family protein
MWAIYSLLSAVCGGINGVLSKRCAEKTDAESLTALRTVVVLLIAGAAVWLGGAWIELVRISIGEWFLLSLSGIATALAWFFYFRAMKDGVVSVVAAIEKFSVVLTMLGGWLILGEAMTVGKWISLFMITAGILLMIRRKSTKIDKPITDYRNRQPNQKWMFWALLSVVAVTVSTLLSKIGVRSADSRVSLLIRSIAVLVFSAAVVLWRGFRRNLLRVEVGALPQIVLSGVLTGVGWLFFFRALSLGEVGLVHPVDKLSVFVTVVLSSICFGEQLSLRVGMGLLILSLGISLLIIL